MRPPSKAFTLIELIVVVTVVGILMLVGINGITSAQKHAQMNQAVDQIVGMIQDVRSRALSHLEMEFLGETCLTETYELRFTSTTQIDTYAVFENDPINCFRTEELLDSYELPEGTGYELLPATMQKLTYEPPLSEVTADPPGGSNVFRIRVNVADDTFTKTIRVTKASGIPEIQ